MFNPPVWPVMDHSDLQLILEADPRALRGPMSRRFAKAFSDFTQVPYVIPVANGTVSLELILKALGIGPGDEVILPPYTFIATFSSIAYTGALPVFADIEPDTYNLSSLRTEEKITDHTRAIVAVAVAGRPFDLDAFEALSRKYGIPLIVDAAQAVGAEFRGKSIASYGAAASFSCQNTKNLTSGEGGIITTKDPVLYEKLQSLLDQEPGPCLGEVPCALLLSQLSRLPAQMEKRSAAADYLNAHLADSHLVRPLARDGRITRDAHHLYVLRTRTEELAAAGFSRENLLKDAHQMGLPLLAGYQPLYALPSVRSEMTRRLTGRQTDLTPLPVCEKASYREGLWLEQFFLLSERIELDEILEIFGALERRYFS